MFQLSQEGQDFVKKELVRYETKMSAIIPSLFRVQKEFGWVPPEAVRFLSQIMEIPESAINEVRCFYTMFNQKPVGKLHVQVCTNISCAMNGARELVRELCQHYGVKEGEVSADGKVTISRAECLGSCGTAPMAQVNDQYIENLSLDTATKKLKEMGA